MRISLLTMGLTWTNQLLAEVCGKFENVAKRFSKAHVDETDSGMRAHLPEQRNGLLVERKLNDLSPFSFKQGLCMYRKRG